MATDDHDVQSRATVVLAVTASTIALSTAFVFFRLVSRCGVVRKLGWDDCAIVVAWVSLFVDLFFVMPLHGGYVSYVLLVIGT